jgi:Ni/Fe-hydrogenase subunit HybB-like protein
MQFNSTLLIVALCVVTYTTVAAVQFLPAVTERLGWFKSSKLLKQLFFLIVAVGVLVPIMHQTALGMMLIVFAQQVHPLYQTNLLPLLFLSSTVGMGFAAVTIEGAITSSSLKRPFEKDILAGLLNIGRYLMIFFLVLRFADLAYRGVFHFAFEYSRAMVSFWVENALMSVPIWLLATKKARDNSQYIFLSAMAMAAGGILYRVAAYLIAYDTGGNWHYFPSIGEWVITIGLIAAEVLCIIVAVRLLPILPAEPGSRTSS